jgi:hypothetical protein
VKVAIEVKNRDEATALKVAMGDPATRAFTLVMGTLLQLPTGRSRRRVLEFAIDHLGEQAAAGAETSDSN